ncbi:MAG TPA: glycoside hydrolase family 15 protein [Acetobacteraceae bacterium]|nr:glycoside hydrolase family 15 protein [Acetobacteraceae bacterium]
MSAPAELPLAIEDYALIGDCRSAALVGRNGSIDWLCLPRFDSDACFAALLGNASHGRFRIAPAAAEPRVRRAYRDGTLVLETEFETEGGAVAVIDFMVWGGGHPTLVRLVEGRRGRVAMTIELVIRFDYGLTVPWVTRLEDGSGLSAVAGPHQLVLRTPVAVRGEDMATRGHFTVNEGQTIPFVLAYCGSVERVPAAIDPTHALEQTASHWRVWSRRMREAGEWTEPVRRSLITLKALTYGPTGGMVAAPTASLPEALGGSRNWDYRYCWLRDATLTLVALMEAGYFDEAAAWRDWLIRSVAGSPDQVQIMYGIGGERRLAEWEATWLPGYHGARPVRIGNAAAEQRQLDVYGEVVDALHHAREGGLPLGRAPWALQQAVMEHLEAIWAEPDDGIWEVRGGRRHFVHSKVMAWVAFDRVLRDAEAYGLPAPLERWRALVARMHGEICAKGFDATRNTFTQSYGSPALDASLLMIPVVGFLPVDDPRVTGTVAAIERELLVDGFVQRYRSEGGVDGLPAGEGAFLACSFWLADAYAMQGREREARAMFERLLALRNDVGLLAEEYDPKAGRQVGNFPQAFSHLALVGTALNLIARGPAQKRSRRGRNRAR